MRKGELLMVKNPMPSIEFQGRIYKLRKRKVEVPDLATMSELEALIWINQNTIPRGYQKEKPRIGGVTLIQ